MQSIPRLERLITSTLLGFSFFAGLAIFSTMLWSRGNTFAVVAPIVRLFDPAASPAAVSNVHDLSRKVGHFFIPAIGFGLLVAGPLRKRPLTALLLCAAFAFVDEGLQKFSPGRTGSIYDVVLDTSGAFFSFCVYSAITRWRRRASYQLG